MTVNPSRRERTIVVLKITTPEDLADSIAAAVGGRARAITLLEATLAALRTAP